MTHPAPVLHHANEGVEIGHFVSWICSFPKLRWLGSSIRGHRWCSGTLIGMKEENVGLVCASFGTKLRIV